MLDTDQMFIEKAIIHRLDNSNHPNGKDLSDLKLNLENELREVITEHAINGVNDKRRRFAIFNDRDTNIVNQICSSFNQDTTNFVDKSKRLANNLYQHMGNRSISAADLVVCYISDQTNNFLGLLKLDYKNQYISQVRNTEEGKLITIRKEEKGWPELGTRIQKAAFIKLSFENDEDEEIVENDPDLIILDRQKSVSEEGEISAFFKDSFLNVELIADEKSNTKSFLKGLDDFRDNFDGIEYEKIASIYDQGISVVAQNESIDIENFIEQQFDLEESEEDLVTAEALKGFFEKHGVSRGRFNVSEEISKKFRDKRQLILDGLKLDIDNTIYFDRDKFNVEYYEQSGVVLANINIRGLPVRERPDDDQQNNDQSEDD